MARGMDIRAIFMMGIVVIVLYFIADVIAVILIVPFLLGSIMIGADPALVIIVTILLIIFILGIVFRAAGFRRK
ncbi:MAG: hypothetical protein KAJ19_21185 [Gammaproteobacteria bacterium]|nr:hypothetical protein [Gammaproteobacteria bacterium]